METAMNGHTQPKLGTTQPKLGTSTTGSKPQVNAAAQLNRRPAKMAARRRHGAQSQTARIDALLRDGVARTSSQVAKALGFQMKSASGVLCAGVQDGRIAVDATCNPRKYKLKRAAKSLIAPRQMPKAIARKASTGEMLLDQLNFAMIALRETLVSIEEAERYIAAIEAIRNGKL